MTEPKTPPDASEREHCRMSALAYFGVYEDRPLTRGSNSDQLCELLLRERAAAFKDGDKAGYERGRAEPGPLCVDFGKSADELREFGRQLESEGRPGPLALYHGVMALEAKAIAAAKRAATRPGLGYEYDGESGAGA